MRRAISNVSTRHGQSLAIEICSTLRQLQSSYQRIYVSTSTSKGFTEDLIVKIEVMKASVAKVENACYNVKVRGSEIPDGWGIDSRDNGNKRDRDDEEEGGKGKRRRFDDN
jgi:Translin family